MDRRIQFLQAFLGALGAERLDITEATPTRITGTVTYRLCPGEVLGDLEDTEQDFAWYEEHAPSNDVLRLAEMMNLQRILNADKITVNRGELLDRYNRFTKSNFDELKFAAILEQLLEVEVPMRDDGVDTDIFFIHE